MYLYMYVYYTHIGLVFDIVKCKSNFGDCKMLGIFGKMKFIFKDYTRHELVFNRTFLGKLSHVFPNAQIQKSE